MKKTRLLSMTLVLNLTVPVVAQDYGYTQQATAPSQQQLGPVAEQIAFLEKDWARIKYQVAGEDAKLDAIHKLGFRQVYLVEKCLPLHITNGCIRIRAVAQR